MSDNLFITLEQKPEFVFELSSPAMKMEFTADLQDSNVHEWFRVFEKVLLAAGFSERVIMKGGAELAFNGYRDAADMRWVYDEYDLGEFGKLPDEE